MNRRKYRIYFEYRNGLQGTAVHVGEKEEEVHKESRKPTNSYSTASKLHAST
jgi:hypothetical protein